MNREVTSYRRASSTIVSSLLLVVITIVGFSLISAFTNNWISLQRINEMETIRERLILDDAWFRSDPYSIDLTVTNVGVIDVKIRFIKVNEVKLVEWEGAELIEVEKDRSTLIVIPFETSWSTDTEYTVRITTDRGNVYEAVFWSPSS